MHHKPESQRRLEITQKYVIFSTTFRTCPTNLDLICGTDNVTYTNECNLKAIACQTDTQIEIASKGKCGQESSQPTLEAIEADIGES